MSYIYRRVLGPPLKNRGDFFFVTHVEKNVETQFQPAHVTTKMLCRQWDELVKLYFGLCFNNKEVLDSFSSSTQTYCSYQYSDCDETLLITATVQNDKPHKRFYFPSCLSRIKSKSQTTFFSLMGGPNTLPYISLLCSSTVSISPPLQNLK